MNADFYKLMLITNRQNRPLDEYIDFIKICAKSGITAVQLREKNANYTELVEFGRALQEALALFDIPLIINDSIELALKLDAYGLHLGQKDGDAIKARELLGDKKVLGVSVDSLEQVLIANNLPIDYIGCGAIFPTKNKLDITTLWGVEGLKEVVKTSQHKVVAIGGIDELSISKVMTAKPDGIAAIGAFHDTQDLNLTTKILRSIVCQ